MEKELNTDKQTALLELRGFFRDERSVFLCRFIRLPNISAYLKEFNNNMEKLFEVTDNMDIISDCFKARLREQLKKH